MFVEKNLKFVQILGDIFFSSFPDSFQADCFEILLIKEYFSPCFFTEWAR